MRQWAYHGSRRHDLHAAVVARGMGTCCVSGGDLNISEKIMKLGLRIQGRRHISIDGSTKQRIRRSYPRKPAELTGDFATIMQWADEMRTLVTPTPIRQKTPSYQRREGIGLCRTELYVLPGRPYCMRE